uniref:Nucleotidyltransferase domain-containing protein n=1 Tax=Thermodesulfobacterium geofontis TaxID=1295609 RepID=A0A7V6CD39_9BACT
MDKETAKKILEIMLTADGGCEYCVRDLYLKFIKAFPEYAYLARKMYREKFNQELITEELAEEIIKDVIHEVVENNHLQLEKIMLFGSRVRKTERKDSDWDVLLITKQDIDKHTKRKLFKEITEKLSYYLIPCDVIIKSGKEIEHYKDFYGTATYEALREGKIL